MPGQLIFNFRVLRITIPKISPICLVFTPLGMKYQWAKKIIKIIIHIPYRHKVVTSEAVRVQSIAVSASVCLSVCLSVCTLAYIINYTFTKFSVHVNCGRGSVSLWQQCNTWCTFGFVNEVTFSYNGANGPKWKTALCFVEFARWRHRRQSCSLRLQACLVNLRNAEDCSTRHKITS